MKIKKTKCPNQVNRSFAWPRRAVLVQVMTSTLVCSFAFSAAAQNTVPTPGTDPEFIKGLIKRMDDLEAKAKRVDVLESQINELKLKSGESVTASAPVEAWPKIDFHVLGDVDFHLSSDRSEHNTFELGDLDVVTTTRLNEQAKVVNDLVVASNHRGYEIEIERLLLSYKFNDHFNLDVGRFHTAMGWYNNFYHNGSYFQTTTERPRMFLFEDGEGITPVHSTGISLNGEIPSGNWGLSYSFEVANGRNYTADSTAALSVADDNDYKSVNFQLRAKPEWAPHWQFGAGAYHDTLTPELDPTGNPGVLTRVDQLIFSGYAVYKGPVYEWFNEYLIMGNQMHGDQRHWTSAAYTQFSRKFGQFRPYVRLQWLNGAQNDPVLGLIGQNELVWGPQIGIRYDFTTMMAAKFEFEHSEFHARSSVDEISMQLTFRY